MTKIAGGKGRITAVVERQAPGVQTISDTYIGEAAGFSARHVRGRYDVTVTEADGSTATFIWQPPSPDDPIPQVGAEVEYELSRLG